MMPHDMRDKNYVQKCSFGFELMILIALAFTGENSGGPFDKYICTTRIKKISDILFLLIA